MNKLYIFVLVSAAFVAMNAAQSPKAYELARQRAHIQQSYMQNKLKFFKGLGEPVLLHAIATRIRTMNKQESSQPFTIIITPPETKE